MTQQWAELGRDLESASARLLDSRTPEAQALYPLRAATAEWTNALARNRGLYQVRVRGLAKVHAVLLLYALVHNLMQSRVLRAALS